MAENAAGVVEPHSGARHNLGVRCVLPELMDDPGLPPAVHRSALAGLARINLLSAVAASFHTPLRQLCRRLRGRQVRVLDVATGGGDVPLRLARWAHRRRLPLAIAGCDVSPRAVAWAAAQAESLCVPVHFFPHDVSGDGVPAGYDAVISSLFLHHLPTPQATRVLAAMGAAASHLVAVNDLLRSPLAYALAWAGTRALAASPVVRTDGPLSVRAAFTLGEARGLAADAGLDGAVVRWRWPFRFLLTWRRQ